MEQNLDEGEALLEKESERLLDDACHKFEWGELNLDDEQKKRLEKECRE